MVGGNESEKNANTAADRRPITAFGRMFRFAAGLLPGFIKAPIVRGLQSRGINVYKLPVLSTKSPSKRAITEEQRALLAPDINADLELLEDSMGFDCSKWHIQ